MSLGRLIELCDGATLVRCAGQLVEEYEHYIGGKKDLQGASSTGAAITGASGTYHGGPESVLVACIAPFLFAGAAHGAAHSVSSVAAAVASQQAQQAAAASSTTNAPSEPIKPTLHKVNNQVVYEYLHTQTTCMVSAHKLSHTESR